MVLRFSLVQSLWRKVSEVLRLHPLATCPAIYCSKTQSVLSGIGLRSFNDLAFIDQLD
jgi:hypothetical protein